MGMHSFRKIITSILACLRQTEEMKSAISYYHVVVATQYMVAGVVGAAGSTGLRLKE
jgi:hypothetical protein